MSRIIITLSKGDIGDLLLGGEVSITPSSHNFDNLREIIIKHEEYNHNSVIEEAIHDKN